MGDNGREELRGIFLPTFQKVLELINGQIEQVNNKFGPGSLNVSIDWDVLIVVCVFGWRTRIEYFST